MKTSAFFLMALMAAGSLQLHAQKKLIAKDKPNIIFILTDDLGYGDVGVFNQLMRAKANDRTKPFISTPNIDNMAYQGAMLTNSYAAAPVCAPSRSSILTGLSQGHARVRDNQFDKDLADNYTLANVLKKAGYATAAIGKWGLQGDNRWTADGNDWPAHPLKRGFDFFYGYMRHNDGHEHYPKEGVYEKPKEVWSNYTEVSKNLDKCYTADLWTAAAKNWITLQAKKKTQGGPFFMYLAYDTPHAVLELPTGPYPAGGGVNGGLQWLGKHGEIINTALGTVDSWTHPDYANATWDNDNNPNTPEVPWPDTYKRYATSVRRIDDAIGDLIKLLSDLKIDDNTLIVFSSDNGPSVEAYLPKPHVGYAANFFGSFGPFDGIKRDLLEGGVRMPVIARWPAHIAAGITVSKPTISYDWLPTFADAAGLPAPANADGVSILPSLTGNGKQADGLIYSEYFEGGRSPNYKEFAANNRAKLRNQMQMIRLGNLVGLRYNVKSANDDFEIFNIDTDTHQSNNLAVNVQMATVQRAMKNKALQARRIDTTARRPYDDAFIPADEVSNLTRGLNWKGYNGNYPWLPQLSALKSIEAGVWSKGVGNGLLKKGKSNIYLFEGYMEIPRDGDYTFYLTAANKAFLRIHQACAIDADYGYVAGQTKQTTLKLKKGMHALKLYFYADAKAPRLPQLQWQTNAGVKTDIPASVFYHTKL